MTMEKDANKLVEVYEKYNGSEVKVQKILGAPSTNPSNI